MITPFPCQAILECNPGVDRRDIENVTRDPPSPRRRESGSLRPGNRRITVHMDSAGNFDAGVAKDLSGKGLNGCVLAPGIDWQASFTAGLIEKSSAVPILFHRNLGQQQSTVRALRDQ